MELTVVAPDPPPSVMSLAIGWRQIANTNYTVYYYYYYYYYTDREALAHRYPPPTPRSRGRGEDQDPISPATALYLVRSGRPPRGAG